MHNPSATDRIPLGESGLAVAPLGWGMWRFAGADKRVARGRVEAALEIGCTLFDTADVYGLGGPGGFGSAEALLGEVLKGEHALRKRMVIATKGGITPPVPYDSSAAYLVAACEASLTRLGIDCIDLYQVHRPDLLAHPAEVAAAFDTLRAAGKIRAAGVSNYSAAQLDALCAHVTFGLATIQPEFSPLAIEPLADGILDAALRHGLAVLAWSPLGQGRLPGCTRDAAAAAEHEDRRGHRGARRRGASRRPVPLGGRLRLDHGAPDARPIPLVGSQNPARIREARGAYAVHLTRPEWYGILEAARGARMP